MQTYAQQATQHFYEWELLGRGYYHFNEPVVIAPPYRPFHHLTDYEVNNDDGIVPPWWKRIVKSISPEKQAQRQEKPSLQPQAFDDYDRKLVVLSLKARDEESIEPQIYHEWCAMVTATIPFCCFEIAATATSILIRLVVHQEDEPLLRSYLGSYLPHLLLERDTPLSMPFDLDQHIAIADCGLAQECMIPIHQAESFKRDPLQSIFSVFADLQESEGAVIQVITQRTNDPWAHDMRKSVSDGVGGSFFGNDSDMPRYAHEKTQHPLCAVVMRIAAQGHHQSRSNELASLLIEAVSLSSQSSNNALMALTNEGYVYDDHLYNLYHRTSNRLGMLLNTHELTTFLHFPQPSVITHVPLYDNKKTANAPFHARDNEYVIGINHHQGESCEVSLSNEMMMQHTHMIGSTGVGKSTLMAQMILANIEHGYGAALFDPHGDIVETVLKRIPEHRIPDVIIIDPADSDFPIGCNILHAQHEHERIVLSSDIVGAFQKQSSAWGDNMTTVLSQAVNTVLYSSDGGTLLELKKLLIEDDFRSSFLTTVDDPTILYFWHHEYPRLKKGITPLLTRIDTFLRPRVIRNMFAQKQGVDFGEAVGSNKIILMKLSQGLIGEHNSALLGTLFIAKLHQVILGRQRLPEHQRIPFFIYLDEAHNFLTNSISELLSGSRKYACGLVLAHQFLDQIEDVKIKKSLLANVYSRICFRLSYHDAKALEYDFASFNAEDFTHLKRGEAIIKLGTSADDANIETYPISDITEADAQRTTTTIINQSRNQYSQGRATVEAIVANMLNTKTSSKKPPPEPLKTTPQVEPPLGMAEPSVVPLDEATFEEEKKRYQEHQREQEVISRHEALKQLVRTIGLQRGFQVRLEQATTSGGRIDVCLHREDISIAIEISVANSVDYEVKNINKCFDEGFTTVMMISDDPVHLNNIKKACNATLNKKQIKSLIFLTPEELAATLDHKTQPKPSSKSKKIRGYRVKTNFTDVQNMSSDDKEQTIHNIILDSLKNKKPPSNE